MANLWKIANGAISAEVVNRFSSTTSSIVNTTTLDASANSLRTRPLTPGLKPNSFLAGEAGGFAAPATGTAVSGAAINAVSSIAGNTPIGGALNTILAGGNLNDVVSNVVGNVAGGILNDALRSLPPELQQIFGDAFGQAFNSAAGTTTFIPPITTDSFLQSLQGGLSQINSPVTGNALGGGIGNLLNSTGLTGALGSLAGGLGGALGNSVGGALSGMAGALGNMAGQLAGGLGSAISSIPGVGPAFETFSGAVGGFVNNIGNAFAALPPNQQQLVGGLVVNVGANIVNNVIRKPTISSDNSANIRKNLSFNDSPVGNCESIASAATAMDKLVYPVTKDNSFADVATKCKVASNELRKCIRNVDGSFQFINNTDRALSDANNTFFVGNNTATITTLSFEQSLQQQQLAVYQDNLFAANSLYGSRGGALYKDLCSKRVPSTPDTRDYYTELATAGKLVVFLTLVNEFLSVYNGKTV
jgi:hypothetical protein